jgi:hypothetical protein
MIKGVIEFVHISFRPHFLVNSPLNLKKRLLIFKGTPQNELVTEKMIEILLDGSPDAQKMVEAARISFVGVIGTVIAISLTVSGNEFNILRRKLVEKIHIFSLFHLIYNIISYFFIIFKKTKDFSLEELNFLFMENFSEIFVGKFEEKIFLTKSKGNGLDFNSVIIFYFLGSFQ